jgi:peptide/nickel transport system permease protein
VLKEQTAIAQRRSQEDERAQGMARLVMRRLLRHPLGRVGLLLLTMMIFMGIFASILAPYDPLQQIDGAELQPPSAQHLLGTDELGRDLLSRIIYGARISLIVGIVAVSLGAVVGVSTGMLAGYLGGWFETITMRIWDTLMAFPGVLLAIAVSAIVGPGLLNAGIAVAIISMPGYARLARAGVLAEREKEYVTAARAIGQRRMTVIFRHILPNAISPILTQIALGMAGAVFLEAGLSFLGLGAQPPTPSWGAMLADSRVYLRGAPWYGIAPGVAISMFLLGLNMLADGLRDVLDPRHIHTK